MLTTTPHLRTRRPSPTTVEYTVLTSPTLTLPLRLLILLTFILRLVVALAILQLLYSRYLLSSYAGDGEVYTTVPALLSIDYMSYRLHALTHTRLGQLFTLLASRTPLIILLPLSLSSLYILSLRLHTTESLLVLRGLGIQTSSSSNTYLSSSTKRFIPTEKIQDILVNEAFRGFEVRYYLVVVVEGEEEVVVVFPRLLPRRDIVERVWRGCRACLEREREKDGGAMNGGGQLPEFKRRETS
ncbi:GPI-GlcNAc transferase complex [Cadophora sp. MPI-SDFR-AT-0126]|nr:GPI-GlcNAc transferase complex [Leotiomycetes sp. MPI-SDFR-AT-0126]